MTAGAGVQYAAVTRMRWRLMVNSLRSRRGKFELGTSIFQTAFFLLLWLGVGFGLEMAAWHFAAHNRLDRLSLLLWPVLVAWQALPVMLTSFQEQVDLTILLRFPVRFRSYVGLYLFFGLFDLSSLLGAVALIGIWIGAVSARPDLAGWLTLALGLFAAFNLLLTRMIFAWIERWLAQRKTREILTILTLFFFLGLQFLNPAFHQNTEHPSSRQQSAWLHAERTAERLQRPLPPALTTRSIELAGRGDGLRALAPLGWLALYAIGAGVLLGIRLRREYRGENLGEAPRRVARAAQEPVRAQRARKWRTRLLGAGPLGAVIEKEIHYLARSGVMLYSLIAPLVLLFLFGGTSQTGRGMAYAYALPLGAAYGFLGLTRFMANSLGGEGEGIQLYFLAPTPFRTVILGKNLLHIGLLCGELTLATVIVWLRFGMPAPQLIVATFCWVLFALPVQLAAGNLLSIFLAYRMTGTRTARGEGAVGNGFISLAIQALLFAVGACIFLVLDQLGHAQLAAPAFLFLAAGGVAAWIWVLFRVDRMAARRREALTAALVRAA